MTILLVLFVVTMFLWGLALVEVLPSAPKAASWLAFLACLILGLVVFLVGTGMIVVEVVGTRATH